MSVAGMRSKIVGWDEVLSTASQLYDLREVIIIGKKQSGPGRPFGPLKAGLVRQILMYVFATRGESRAAIAIAFRRDRSAVNFACRKITKLVQNRSKSANKLKWDIAFIDAATPVRS